LASKRPPAGNTNEQRGDSATLPEQHYLSDSFSALPPPCLQQCVTTTTLRRSPQRTIRSGQGFRPQALTRRRRRRRRCRSPRPCASVRRTAGDLHATHGRRRRPRRSHRRRLHPHDLHHYRRRPDSLDMVASVRRQARSRRRAGAPPTRAPPPPTGAHACACGSQGQWRRRGASGTSPPAPRCRTNGSRSARRTTLPLRCRPYPQAARRQGNRRTRRLLLPLEMQMPWKRWWPRQAPPTTTSPSSMPPSLAHPARDSWRKPSAAKHTRPAARACDAAAAARQARSFPASLAAAAGTTASRHPRSSTRAHLAKQLLCACMILRSTASDANNTTSTSNVMSWRAK
jgi:hypothetical protein